MLIKNTITKCGSLQFALRFADSQRISTKDVGLLTA